MIGTYVHGVTSVKFGNAAEQVGNRGTWARTLVFQLDSGTEFEVTLFASDPEALLLNPMERENHED